MGCSTQGLTRVNVKKRKEILIVAVNQDTSRLIVRSSRAAPAVEILTSFLSTIQAVTRTMRSGIPICMDPRNLMSRL
jgi:hypothetical protein